MLLIKTGQPITLEYVTADRKRGTGGELIKCENWQLVRPLPDKQPATTGQAAGEPAPPATTATKDPNHFQHKTFNIFNPANRSAHVRKVHYRLLLTLNGKRIING
jgi:hypothetical protein